MKNEKIYVRLAPPKRGNPLKAWNWFRLNNPFQKGMPPKTMRLIYVKAENQKLWIASYGYRASNGAVVDLTMTLKPVLLDLILLDGGANWEKIKEVRETLQMEVQK